MGQGIVRLRTPKWVLCEVRTGSRFGHVIHQLNEPLIKSMNMNSTSTTLAILTGLLLSATPGVFAQVPSPVAAAPVAVAQPAANVGQTVTISSTSYVVSAKQQLAAGVEYYTMKAATPKSVAKNYLRTREKYSATVFTQAQFEAFLKTGKMSSFGTLVKKDVEGRKVVYVEKGSTKALLGADGGELIIYEFIGDLTSVLLQDNGSGGTVDRKKCGKVCFDNWDECMANSTSSEAEGLCMARFFGCIGWCDDHAANSDGTRTSFHSIPFSKPILAK